MPRPRPIPPGARALARLPRRAGATDELLSDDDWPAAADRYADEHDRYMDVTIRVEGWMQQVFLDGGLEGRPSA